MKPISHKDIKSVQTDELEPRIPVWVEGFVLQGASLLVIFLSFSALFAGIAGWAASAVRLTVGRSFERTRFLVALILSIFFEFTLWRNEALAYHTPSLFAIPLWAFALWSLGGILVAGILIGGKNTEFVRRPILVLPLLILWIFPKIIVVSVLCALFALVLALRFLAVGEKTGKISPKARVVIAMVLLAAGGTSASFSFGVAGLCSFPEVWNGIPYWAIGLWPSFSLAIVGLSR